MAHKSKEKGDRIEREIVHAHQTAGIRAQRYDARRGQFGATASHDIDIYPKDRDAPLITEVKARKNGKGFATIENWLGDNDALFLRRNGQKPVVVVPWDIWVELVGDREGAGHETP